MISLKKISCLALIGLLCLFFTGYAQIANPLPEEINVVESSYPGMRINMIFDSGKPADNIRYMLRWETLPPNRDLKRTDDLLPEPSMLRLYCLPAMVEAQQPAYRDIYPDTWADTDSSGHDFPSEIRLEAYRLIDQIYDHKSDDPDWLFDN